MQHQVAYGLKAGWLCSVAAAGLVGWLCAAVRAAGAAPGPSDAPIPLRVADLHVDLSYQMTYQGKQLATATGQVPAAALREAGVGLLVLPLFVPHDVAEEGPRLSDLESSYRRLHAALSVTPPYALPGCASLGGHVRTLLSFEGAAPLAGREDQVGLWVSRGLRVFGFVHSYDNALASSSGKGPGLPTPAFGLTDAGRRLAEAVFQHRALIDVSHASDRATRELLDIADATGGVVVATHSNARALANHSRNLADDAIRRIAKTGGVVGVNFHSPFLRRDRRRATVDDVVAHVRHVASVAGVAHVAIGSDYEGGIVPPKELDSVRGLAVLQRALLASGFSAVDVERILFGNAMRVLCPSSCGP